MINLLLIGNGAWGKNYISTVSTFPDIILNIATRDNWKDLINEQPQGVIIATPPQSHIEIADYALQRNIPIMIEKPLSLSLQEAQQLQKYQHIPILVNHLHLFAQAYQNLKNILLPTNIAKIVSLGFNKGPFRDYPALWDYGCHDIAMILDLLQEMPQQISCGSVEANHGSLFDIKMHFSHSYTESLVGNGASKKVRKIKVESQGLSLAYDDRFQPTHFTLPLTNAVQVFINAIQGQSDPRLGLNLALKVMQILEDCQKQL